MGCYCHAQVGTKVPEKRAEEKEASQNMGGVAGKIRKEKMNRVPVMAFASKKELLAN